ncbi:hypothetical protein [Bartonella choladocola]|uniref:hypothetical protein n=1 Tax=Bartonella choladocola TaxID=2750995 RepID=UPI003B528716
MDSVIHTIYMSGIAGSLTCCLGITFFLLIIICPISLIAFVDAPIRTGERRTAGIIALSSVFAIVVSVVTLVLIPSRSARETIITAKIATALADRNLSQPERDYLQKLAASYSLKSELAE